jgi:putative ABC transport system permease protein
MFKHYLTTALRHFRQHKLTTGINVVCLTIGFVCLLAIHAMLTYISHGDKHFANSDRIYFLTQRTNSAVASTFSSFIAAKYLITEFPELETVARATFNSGVGVEVPVTAGDQKSFAYTAYADPAFLEVFALPFLAGDGKNALREPRSAVISKDFALRLFGNVADATGKQLRLRDGLMLTVRGVIDELQKPSHIVTTGDESTPYVRFDVLISMDVLEADLADQQPLAWTTPPSLFTYMVLPKDGSLSIDTLRGRLKVFGARHSSTDGSKLEFDAVSVNDYWLSGVGSIAGTDKNGPILMFYFLGCMVLLISCVNYANLATAQASVRAKEIGMRRAMGARRGQIILQFMLEAALLSLTALLLAFALIVAGVTLSRIPGAATILGNALSSTQLWTLLVSLVAAVTLAAGAYPAFVLSAVRPLEAIRSGKRRSGGLISRVLVGLQFVGASFLLISMLVMNAQNRVLMRTIVDNAPDTFLAMANHIRAAKVDYDVLRTELLKQPHVRDVTASVMTPWSMITMTSVFAQTPDETALRMRAAKSRVHYDFFSTLDIGLLAGRVFDRQHADDFAHSSERSGSRANIVIDQALAERNGWLRPEDALGKVLYDVDAQNRPLPHIVIGVVANKPMSVLSTGGASANAYVLDTAGAAYPIIRIAKGEGTAAMREIESVWNRLAPSVALKMRFADEIMNRNYQGFQSIEVTFNGVAGLALLIAILGLIGMSLDVIGRRRHEIGVRKTLGASVQGIVRLLLTDFSKPVIVANVLAWPLAYVAMQLYLSIFTQRTDLSLTPFVSGLAITVSIAWIAVAAQATRAARTNPATVLRYE